jgi:hypothetical protein
MPRSIETETSALAFAQLKDKQRRIREGFPEHIGLRIHRALSWLGRAETDTNDPDVRFILLWISFNSAYAADLRDDLASERGAFNAYFCQPASKFDPRSAFNIDPSGAGVCSRPAA